MYALEHILWATPDTFGGGGPNQQGAQSLQQQPQQQQPKRRRLLMVGDSTMRQLFMALGCRYWMMGNNKTIQTYDLDWAVKGWPCHGTLNCVTTGSHSGFNVGSIILHNGNEIHYLPHSGSLGKAEPGIIGRWRRELDINQTITFGPNLMIPTTPQSMGTNDIILYNIGLHGSEVSNLEEKLQEPANFGNALLQQSLRPTFIAMTTIAQHFQSVNGQYVPGGTTKGACLPSIPVNPRREVELTVWKEGTNVDGIFDYDDLDAGVYHIDSGGKDCTHYCMPGPPDVAIARFLNVLNQLEDTTNKAPTEA
jgi:hypothetical protein